ncbi:glycosyltransferase family 32 protein [Thalassotalea eurytherma]|uniref:Glycosyl transferase n=1 Tax=Thalassotalea eurytherma TaxID=1144278 RepID=A0ABQ6GZA9_9GAMM|nr:glycosyltransferase [Thalassotalea eurytherma]GLX81281.1 hypothetical protein theurythT_07330 [Thalassotalea eurytherma]
MPELLQNAVKATKSSQWFFKYQLYDDELAKAFISQHYGNTWLDLYTRNKIAASRCDMFRLLALYQLGGFYVDLSMEISTSLSKFRDFDLVLLQRDDMAKQNNRPVESAHFTNSIIGAPKKSPYLKRCITLMQNRLESGSYNNDVIQATGPGILNECLKSIDEDFKFNKVQFSLARGNLFNYRRVKGFSNSWVEQQKSGIY